MIDKSREPCFTKRDTLWPKPTTCNLNLTHQSLISKMADFPRWKSRKDKDQTVVKAVAHG